MLHARKTKTMKKLLILFVLISANCFGQSAITFVDTSATWNVAKTYPGGDIGHPNFIATVTRVYGFNGDTLIGSNVWNKIYSTSDSSFSSNLTYLGKLREENSLVLFMDTNSIIDTIYNFNLQTGDSVYYGLPLGNTYLYVSSTDSININNVFHKRIIFSESNGGFQKLKEIWIEGIGSIHGPLFPANPRLFETEMPDSIILTCYKINDTAIWINPNYNDCYINIVLSVNDFQESHENIIAFPNPVTNELKIELPKNTIEEYLVSIYDITGRLVLTKSYILKGQLAINTRDLKDGFYILQISSGVDTYRTKFIKQ
jgi:hypothetical protein